MSLPRIYKFTFATFGFFCLIQTTSPSLHAESGTSSLVFLKIAPGTRAVAMGEAATALESDLAAAYWNPAATVGLKSHHALFLQNFFILDVNYNYAGFGWGNGKRALGTTLTLSNLSGIQRRGDNPLAEPLGAFELNDAALSFFYAREVREKVSVGGSAKILYEKIDLASDFTWALDLGGTYRLRPELTVGAAFANLGPKLRLQSESFRLPLRGSLGAAYRWRQVLVTSDFVKFNDGSLKWHLGAEYSFEKYFALRSGWQLGYSDKNFSAGFGLKYQRFVVDYAFVPFQSDLGQSHRISLEVVF